MTNYHHARRSRLPLSISVAFPRNSLNEDRWSPGSPGEADYATKLYPSASVNMTYSPVGKTAYRMLFYMNPRIRTARRATQLRYQKCGEARYTHNGFAQLPGGHSRSCHRMEQLSQYSLIPTRLHSFLRASSRY